MAAAASEDSSDLRQRVTSYLRDHHTMTIATMGPVGDPAASAAETAGNAPHAASVFYAMDDSLRLIFLSKPSSLHGLHIGERAAVAATVSEQYDDWEMIKGVQLWGEARRLRGAARAGALALYVARFPFVSGVLKRPGMATLMKSMGVYRVEPQRVAFTDNTTGVFGREVLDMKVE